MPSLIKSKRNIFLFIFLSFLPILSICQLTFTEDIAPIIYNHCTSCHRVGEIGPFPLTNFENVRDHGNTIKYVTASKYMPPWKADPEYRHFLDENILSQEEIDKIGQWVDEGMVRGNEDDEPPLPIFPKGSLLGEPDLVLSFEKSYLHKGTNDDEYRYFVLPTGLIDDKIIKAIELRPGNSKIVHHALFFSDTDGILAGHDQLTEEYGFSAYSGFDENRVLFYEQYPGYVPGQKARYYPESLGQTIKANADLIIQMHYAPSPTDERDSSSVNIFFADENEIIDRKVRNKIMLPFDLESGPNSFYIRPNQVRSFRGKWTITQDISLISLIPHMHLLGRNWEVWLERPDGSRANLIKINDWDFDWQGSYNFRKFIYAPKGSFLYAQAEYDNTLDNYRNPSNPPVFVSWGEKTTDEMYYLPIYYVNYLEGDEGIYFDGELPLDDEESVALPKENKFLDIFPNPSSEGLINLRFQLSQGGPINIDLFDLEGRFLKSIKKGEFFAAKKHIVNINASVLSSGVYAVAITGDSFYLTKQFVVTR